jgi:hypothetical protein
MGRLVFMQYHNVISTVNVDSQVLGILVVIPVTGSKKEPLMATFKKCDKCGRLQNWGSELFCSTCGGKFIEVTEFPKNYRGDNQEQTVPIPDVRAEMKELGIENHVTFGEDSISEDFIEDDCNWIFVIKEYLALGNQDYFQPFLKELDLQQIQNDLAEAKEKFKEITAKYNGKVVFGLTGDHVD